MHGHYENITKVSLLLTEPSQVSEVGPREGEQQAALHLCGSRGDCSRVSASQPETGTHYCKLFVMPRIAFVVCL
jgi:hypothetical protein